MTLGVLRVTTDGLRLWASAENGGLTVAMSGNCEMESIPLLDSYFASLHSEVTRAGTTKVVLDCESLYFMNSSSIKCFVTWLAKVRQLAQPNRYRVHFKTNKQFAWQRRSLEAVRRYAPDLVTLE